MDDFFLYRNRPQIDLKQAGELETSCAAEAIVNPTMDTRRDVKYRSETLSRAATSSAPPKSSRWCPAPSRRPAASSPSSTSPTRRTSASSAPTCATACSAPRIPINKNIKIGRTGFRVIGVMEKQGGSFLGGPNFDRQIYIPITSYVKAFGGHRGRQGVDVAVKAPSQEALEELEFEVIGEMRKIRKLRPAEDDNFSINKLDTLVGAFNNVMGVVLLVGLLVTSISLFVGGVGVMNIMFVSVTERTREIGIRKAIGAKPHSILLQFLFESAAICLLGGMIGILVASILTAVINKVLMPASVSFPILIIAVVVSIAVGVLAGLVPAFRGSRLNPIEALRYE